LQRVSGEDEIDGNQVVIDNDDEVVDVKMDESCLVVVVVGFVVVVEEERDDEEGREHEHKINTRLDVWAEGGFLYVT
jgi:hypothetical protein